MKLRLLFLVALIVVAASVLAQTPTTVVCESDNGHYRECSTDFGRVTLTRQLSSTRCVEGQSWGTRNGVVWVDNGCRAEFTVNATGRTMRANRRARQNMETVVCESGGGRSRCSANTNRGVQLTRQISRSSCEMGRDWGYDQNGIWVDNGCRAEFTLGPRNRNRNRDTATMNQPTYSSSTYNSFICESQNNTRHTCDANAPYGVTLMRQISSNNCVEGRTWGTDRNGDVWVSGGCRAEFRVNTYR